MNNTTILLDSKEARQIIKEAIAEELQKFDIKHYLEDQFITYDEVAQLLNISRNTVFDLRSKGVFKSYKIGGNVRYKKSEVLAALKPQNPIPLPHEKEN